MDRQVFEQLVSAWLDQPDRDALRALVHDAVREDPALLPLLKQWLRLHKHVRTALPEPPGVAWDHFRAQLSVALDCAAGRNERRRRQARN